MLNYEKYVARLGEHGVQDLIERMERYKGIRHTHPVSLEDRWHALMGASEQNALAA